MVSARLKTTATVLLAATIAWTLSFLALRTARRSLYDEDHATKRLRVAAVAIECDVDSVVNRRRILDALLAVTRQHPSVDLVMFGETITGWYSMGAETAEYHRRIAETIPGETTALMATAARDHGVHVCFGMSESRGGSVHNSQVLIAPTGAIVAVHRKFDAHGSPVFAAGTVPATMVDIQGVRTAIIICSDIRSAEVRSALHTQKPDLILGSLANASDRNWFVSGLIAKAFGAWILTANRYGQDGRQFFDGQMIVADPLGELRVKAKDRPQHIYYEMRFDEQPSPVRGFVLDLYRFQSFGAHLIAAVPSLLQRT